MTSPDNLGKQFGPWKITPTMKTVHSYMQENHTGVENRENLWDIAAGAIRSTGGYVSNNRHHTYFEAINRLADNGTVRIHNGYEDTAWIPQPGEKDPEN